MSVDAGGAAPVWPNIIPVAGRRRLRARTGLRDRLDRYAAALGNLSRPQRARVLNCLAQQNEIANLVRCRIDCDALEDLPGLIRAPVLDLFSFSFSLLTDLGIRDRHYRAIYGALPYKVCPFCGSEFFDDPGAPREDLDHYLASSRYPFAAANLRNLSPMGIKCNARYKLATDILRDSNGRRRRAFDPYATRQIRVSLLNSVPFAALGGRAPAWQIDFLPDSPECTTWDEVFSVRERLQRDVLKDCFPRWLQEFAAWFVRRKGIDDLNDRQLTASVREHAENMALQGFMAKDFLRAHVFEMVHEHCRRRNRRMLDFLRALVTKAVPQPAPFR